MTGIHIGTMGWSYKFWWGNFYHEGISSNEFLSEYAKHFHTVEMDSTFYRIPSIRTIEKWKSQTPDDFIFSSKFPRAITHGKNWDERGEKRDIFIHNISHLGNKLGPLLLQFPPQFKAKEYIYLKDLLDQMPNGYSYAVEFRDKEWLEERIYEILRDKQIALVLVDHPWMPTLDVTASHFTYIRWQGDSRKVKGNLGKEEIDRVEDLKKWAERIEKMRNCSIEIFGYFSKFYSGHPPSDVKRLNEYIKGE